MDSLLTVILVIRDRPFYTLRWMNYANKTKFPFKILIADGGKDLSVQKNLTNTVHYPNLNYEYLRYPYDENTKKYFCKLADALSRVKTPYVLLADDDDFWNVEAIRISIQFLENNPDYATCRGRNFVFIQKKNVLNTSFNPHSVFDITHESASDRVMAILPSLGGTLYDVHRTSQYQNVFKKIAEIDMHYLPMYEMMAGLMDAASGKIKQLDIPSLFREDGHGQSTSRGENIFSRLMSGPCAENLFAMVKEVAREVAKKESIDIETFASQIRSEYLNQLSFRVSNHLYAYYNITFSSAICDLKTWAIHSLERKYQKIGRFIRSITEKLHHKKIDAAYHHYLKTNPSTKSIFQDINHFLNDYTTTKNLEGRN